MKIELQNCELTISHIGTPYEIAMETTIEKMAELAQVMNDVLRPIIDSLLSFVDEATTAIDAMLGPVAVAMGNMPVPSAVIEAHRMAAEFAKKAGVLYDTCLDA